jgi:hypothetical protein
MVPGLIPTRRAAWATVSMDRSYASARRSCTVRAERRSCERHYEHTEMAVLPLSPRIARKSGRSRQSPATPASSRDPSPHAGFCPQRPIPRHASGTGSLGF